MKDKTLLLTPGNYYLLKVVRIVALPLEDTHFLCVDQNGLKHLIPEKHYYYYGIKPGNIVKCRLDKINCQGRFFFEPENPWYRLDGVYSFKLLNVREVPELSQKGIIIYQAILSDSFQRVYTTRPFDITIAKQMEDKTHLSGKIVRIKKGRLYINVFTNITLILLLS